MATDEKKKKPTLTEQLNEARGLNVSKDATILVLEEKVREAEERGQKGIDALYATKDKEMRSLLITIGTPFGLQSKKTVRGQFSYQEEKDKTVPELAGELAGMMGQLLEEKRIAEARYEEKTKELGWLRGIVERVIPGKVKKVDKIGEVVKDWNRQAENLMNGIDPKENNGGHQHP